MLAAALTRAPRRSRPHRDRAAGPRWPRRRTATPGGDRTAGRRGRRQTQHLQRITEHRAGRGHCPHGRVQRVQQPGKQHPHPLGAAGEPAQPPPHRAHRPAQPDRDRAVPTTGGLPQQRGPDHRHPVRPTGQAPRGQQHMCGAAPRATRTPRTTPHPLVPLPQGSPPGVAPGPQLTGAPRAGQPSTGQQPIDLERVRPYHQHRVPPSTKRRPSPTGQGSGGPLRVHDVVTLSSRTHEGQPRKVTPRTSSASTTPTQLHDLSQGVVQQGGPAIPFLIVSHGCFTMSLPYTASCAWRPTCPRL